MHLKRGSLWSQLCMLCEKVKQWHLWLYTMGIRTHPFIQLIQGSIADITTWIRSECVLRSGRPLRSMITLYCPYCSILLWGPWALEMPSLFHSVSFVIKLQKDTDPWLVLIIRCVQSDMLFKYPNLAAIRHVKYPTPCSNLGKTNHSPSNQPLAGKGQNGWQH